MEDLGVKEDVSLLEREREGREGENKNGGVEEDFGDNAKEK